MKKYKLDKYQILFGDDGKTVTLKSLERKGRSAFSYGINEDYDGEEVEFRISRYLYLHKPKGSNSLEIIK